MLCRRRKHKQRRRGRWLRAEPASIDARTLTMGNGRSTAAWSAAIIQPLLKVHHKSKSQSEPQWRSTISSQGFLLILGTDWWPHFMESSVNWVLYQAMRANEIESQTSHYVVKGGKIPQWGPWVLFAAINSAKNTDINMNEFKEDDGRVRRQKTDDDTEEGKRCDGGLIKKEPHPNAEHSTLRMMDDCSVLLQDHQPLTNALHSTAMCSLPATRDRAPGRIDICWGHNCAPTNSLIKLFQMKGRQHPSLTMNMTSNLIT